MLHSRSGKRLHKVLTCAGSIKCYCDVTMPLPGTAATMENACLRSQSGSGLQASTPTHRTCIRGGMMLHRPPLPVAQGQGQGLITLGQFISNNPPPFFFFSQNGANI